MKIKCVKGECLATEFDNIWYNSGKVKLLKAGVVHFYRSFPDMVAARRISDHVPVWSEFNFSPSDAEVKETVFLEH